jgi:PadR family transcriptional regulator, regulatory protein PadR
MTRRRSHSPQAIGLLRALAADPTTWRHGYDLGAELGLRSGSLYPILIRLCDRGLLESAWETPGEGRPPRHLYRLTAGGLAELASVAPTESRNGVRRTQLGTA